MTELLEEHHPDKHGEYWTNEIDKFVGEAETIGHFLKDTNLIDQMQ